MGQEEFTEPYRINIVFPGINWKIHIHTQPTWIYKLRETPRKRKNRVDNVSTMKENMKKKRSISASHMLLLEISKHIKKAFLKHPENKCKSTKVSCKELPIYLCLLIFLQNHDRLIYDTLQMTELSWINRWFALIYTFLIWFGLAFDLQ